MRKMVRQGDILLIPIEVEAGADLGKPSQSGEVTVAHGEATGHRHRVPHHAQLFELPGTTPSARIQHARELLRSLPKLDDESMPIGVLRVEGKNELVHEEHAAIPIEGDYLALRQREYAPGELRMVAD